MKKIIFLVVLLVLAVLILPAYAPPPSKDVVVTNTPLPIQGDVTVVNTPLPISGNVQVTNTPVPVTVTETLSLKGLKRINPGQMNPANGSGYDLVTLPGPGTFVSAWFRQTGGNGRVSVRLIIDSNTLTDYSAFGLTNAGLTQSNPLGIAAFSGTPSSHNVTIGFPLPIAFKESLVLQAEVKEDSVNNINAIVIYGE